MTSQPAPDADEFSDADDLRRVLGRRRAGLVLGWGALGCAGAALVTWLPAGDRSQEPLPATAFLVVAAVAAAVLCQVFLRRAWSVPVVAGDPAVVRARTWSDVAIAAWGTSLVVGFVFDDLLGLGGAWLVAVRSTLAAVLVVTYAGMLVLATRWRPVPSVSPDQL